MLEGKNCRQEGKKWEEWEVRHVCMYTHIQANEVLQHSSHSHQCMIIYYYYSKLQKGHKQAFLDAVSMTSSLLLNIHTLHKYCKNLYVYPLSNVVYSAKYFIKYANETGLHRGIIISTVWKFESVIPWHE